MKTDALDSKNASLDPIVIEPTGSGGQFSDIAMTNLFTAHLAAINLGKQLIWQRYHVMLTANAILLALLAAKGGESSPFRWVVPVLGVPLYVVWAWLTVQSWISSTNRIKVASRFIWAGLPSERNPVNESLTPVLKSGLRGDATFLLSVLVIGLFLGAHVVSVIVTLCH
ncbi:MAG: hypothetical protein PHC53_03195 [Patescibacteria group bacterium]|nr:hypothetical protein [Patescibacteria group bacterium]